MLSKPLTTSLDNAVKRVFGPGDKLDLSENPINSIASDTAYTFTGKDFAAADVLERTGTAGGALADLIPTADQLIAALIGAYGVDTPPNNAALYQVAQTRDLQWPLQLGRIPPGSSFRIWVRNLVGQTITMTAQSNSGASVSGTATVANNKVRVYLVRLLATAPSVTVSATTTNSSKVLSNISQADINKILPGMSVYGTGIGASAKVVSVNRDAGIVNVDVNSSATADLIGVTFTPTYTMQNLGAMDV